ncbi:hypothetical protein [Streptomyces sp. S1]|uniref:hypothetical protein n=1 Tax=Streptomyces sp. S1 TaxID=718288 RepID=UPI003D710A81
MNRAPDKRDECECHRECSTEQHPCEKPCRWPGCLTDAEADELAAKVMKELWGDDDVG